MCLTDLRSKYNTLIMISELGPDLGENRYESRGLNAAGPDWPTRRVSGGLGDRRWMGGLLGLESLT
jgi:hypothetical protein